MKEDNVDGSMKQFEFSCTALALSGVIFFADIYFSSKLKPELKPPAAKPLTRSEKATLCTGWDKCNLLAEVIVYEARSEPSEGKRMVAKVVLNRVEHKAWPNTLEEVVYEPYQFSYLNDMHKQRTPTQADWESGRNVAFNMLHGFVDVETDATFYHEKRVNPFWADHKEMVAKIGNHVFYSGSK